MNELRELRRAADLSQNKLSELLHVPLNTFRTWDSGLRRVPAPMLLRARAAVEHHAHQTELRRLRAATAQFMASHYRRFGGQASCPPPLPTVPHDYPQHLRALRRRLRLTQDGLARRIGAAGKAVIYQWESRKRTPSPVLWQRVLRLEHREAPDPEHDRLGCRRR